MSRWLDLLLTILGAIVFTGALGWLMVRTLQRTVDPAKLIFKWILTLLVLAGVGALARALLDSFGGVVVPFACVAAGVILSVIWAPHLGAILAKPLSSLYDGGDLEPEPEPLYSIALGKRKRGRFQEAVFDIREQLKRFPHDFTGHLLLAEILAQDLNDVSGAQLTIERLCQQPQHTPPNVALALNQLADWQLKWGQDVDAARASLEKIIALYPGAEMALLAAQRVAHLSGTAELLAAASDPAAIRLRPGVQNIGLLKDSSALRPPEEDPAARAAQYVRQLEQHPLDSEAREQLSMIYAEHYQRMDLATDQLEQLIQQPNQPMRQVTRWSNVLADLQIKLAHDYEAASRTLQRLAEMFPGSATAVQAQQRMAHLKLELKGQQPADPAVKLGTYEQNIGLKKDWLPPKPDAASQPRVSG
jgi:tetratricopeptide (TPR) repeat protein